MAKVFISYRRDDSKWAAGRLREAIEGAFGRDSVFMDTADLIAGSDFKKAIAEEIHSATIVLALIGTKWSGPMQRRRDPNSLEFDTFLPPGISHAWYAYKDINEPIFNHRIRQDNDMVRFELTEAFGQTKPVVPVLIDGAKIPLGILPPPLDQLKHLHHMNVSHETFSENVPTLIGVLRKYLS
jgi:TIR domain